MARVISVGDVQSGEFEPIPAGVKLKVSVYDIQETTVKATGKPQFVWTAKVTEEGPYLGREVRYNYVPLDPAATNLWVLAAFADAVGWNGDKGEVAVPDDLKDVLGTELLASFRISADQQDPEKKYNRVARTYKLSSKPKAKTASWSDV